MTAQFLKERSLMIKQEIEKLLKTARQGKILREGIATAIVGRPNVGKSSLMNALAHENKAIVTDIPGTTRDVIEEYVNVRGITLRLLDTAGIRETEDLVERIGVERSRKALEQADLILLVLNHAEPLQEEDRRLLSLVKEMTAIIIVNKIDLPRKLDLDEVRSLVGDRPMVFLSVKEDRGIEDLEKAISDLFFTGQIETAETTYLTNTRHIDLLEKAKESVQEVISGIEMGLPLDMVEIDLKNAWQFLGEVIGEAVAEDLIDQIFSQFCLGK
jgi:tRNA modification GTPase